MIRLIRQHPFRFLRLWAFMIGGGFLCTGCIFLPVPYKGYDHLSVEGRLLDAATGKPIEGANIEWVSRVKAIKSEAHSSSPDGDFRMPSKKRVRFGYALFPLLLPYDPIRPPYLRIEQEAYRTAFIETSFGAHTGWLWNSMLREKRVDLGELSLVPDPDLPPVVYLLGDDLDEPRLIERSLENRNRFLEHAAQTNTRLENAPYPN